MRYWKFINAAQSCSNNAHVPPLAKEISKADYDAYIAALPVSEPPQLPPARDLAKELDALTAVLVSKGIINES